MASRSSSRNGRRSSKGKKRKGSKAPPPPPPIPRRIHTKEDLDTYVLNYQGCALLTIVTPLCKTSTNTIVPFIEQLNESRPPALKDMNLAILYASEVTAEMCLELELKSAPTFIAYSYGNAIQSFSGDNTDKVMLLAKMAAVAAAEEAARLADIAKKEAAGIPIEDPPAAAN